MSNCSYSEVKKSDIALKQYQARLRACRIASDWAPDEAYEPNYEPNYEPINKDTGLKKGTQNSEQVPIK